MVKVTRQSQNFPFGQGMMSCTKFRKRNFTDQKAHQSHLSNIGQRSLHL